MSCSTPEYDPLAEIYDVWASADPACTPSHDFYVQLCCEAQGSICELGVGTGRIALDVARRKRHIIGVDISSSMLEQCRSRAIESGVQSYIELVQCDLRRVVLPRPSDLVIFPFRSFGHLLSLDDRREALRAIYGLLTPGGRFVFDHYVFCEQWARSHDGVPRLMHSQFSTDGGLFIWDTYRYDFGAQQMHCFITIERTDGQGRVLEKRHCPLSFSWVTPEQVRQMALDIGFEVEALYGDFSRTEFGANSSDQVWVLRRPG
jgi:ubiquinone/menaquinone biosynthesis C-methylase UbiE